mgnify:FL=1
MSGENNVAVGSSALGGNTTGSSNTAVGASALSSTTEGLRNTSMGLISGNANSTGCNNTFVGYGAGMRFTTGDNNIAIGCAAGCGSASPGGEFTTQDNRIIMGNGNHTNAYIKIAWTVTSDLRDKTNFNTIPHGLEFVNKLNPVSFQFRKSREDDTPHGDVRYGFKAQDILALEGDNPVIIDNNQPENLMYKGEHLVPVLVNAIKELSDTNKDLKSRIEALENS